MIGSNMTPEEFRELGHRAVEWVADYWEHLESRPVAPPVEPGAVRAWLPAAAPEDGDGFAPLLDDLDALVLPALVHWQHPRFFGYFPSNASGPAALAELISAGLGVQGMNWNTSPAATEVEQHVLDWFVGLLGLPERFLGGGVIQDTASSATLIAMVAALHRASGGRCRVDGVGAARYRVYITAETHSGAAKAAILAGLGTGAVVTVGTDAAGAMDPVDLERAITADRADGAVPAVVVATRGTTSRLAFDPLAEIGAVCRRHGVWLHVDAAYAGVAAVCDELRWVGDGAEHTDSYCINPHKWLLTNFDCDLLWVADPAALVGALDLTPSFLRSAASDGGAVTDYRNWQVPLGRRFRALKLWAVLRWYGAEGLREHVRAGVRHARLFAELVGADDRFALLGPPLLGFVAFRPVAGDAATRRLLDAVNAEGTTYLTPSEHDGHPFLRFAAGGTLTEDRHVREAWEAIRALV